MWKGIILAGGNGERLYPATIPIVKQLVPIYDKPMIYYPLSTLMLAEIRDVLIISTPRDIGRFEELFKDGSELGMNFSYKIQERSNGIAEAFILGEESIGKGNCSLILGDNLFHGHGFSEILKKAKEKETGATIFGYNVKDPQRYGVVELGRDNKVLSIEEKPENPKSNYAITGLYFYDNDVVEIAKNLKPSDRGELEITDVNKEYLKRGNLDVRLLGEGFAWLDTGTFESLADAGNFVRTIQERQGLKIACIEKIAYDNKWIGKKELMKLAEKYKKSGYGDYLRKICE